MHDFQLFTLETFAIQTVILVVILWVLHRFLFRPYLQYLDTEAKKRSQLEEDYKNITLLQEQAQSESTAIIEKAKQDAEQIRKDATSRAKKEADQIVGLAQQEAEATKLSAESQIQKEREKMMADIRTQSVDLILKFNSKLFDSEKVQKDFVQKQIHSFK